MKGNLFNLLVMLSFPSLAYASGQIPACKKIALLIFVLATIASMFLIVYGFIKYKHPFTKYKSASAVTVAVMMVSYTVLNVMGISTTLFMHFIVAVLGLSQLALYVKIKNA